MMKPICVRVDTPPLYLCLSIRLTSVRYDFQTLCAAVMLAHEAVDFSDSEGSFASFALPSGLANVATTIILR